MNKDKMTTVFTRMLKSGQYQLCYWDGRAVNNKRYKSKEAALQAIKDIFGRNNTIIHDEYAIVSEE